MIRDISSAKCPGCGYFADLLPIDRNLLGLSDPVNIEHLREDGSSTVYQVPRELAGTSDFEVVRALEHLIKSEQERLGPHPVILSDEGPEGARA